MNKSYTNFICENVHFIVLKERGRKMKKIGFIKNAVLTGALLLTLLLTACGPKSASDIIVGRWIFEDGSDTGFEFFENGAAIGFNGNDADSATWTMSEDTIMLSNPYGDEMILMNIEELTEDRLVISIEGREIALVKDDK